MGMGPDLSHGESAVGLLRPEPGTGSLLGSLSWEDESLEPWGTTRDRSLPQNDASGRQAGLEAGGRRPEGRVRGLTMAVPGGKSRPASVWRSWVLVFCLRQPTLGLRHLPPKF